MKNYLFLQFSEGNRLSTLDRMNELATKGWKFIGVVNNDTIIMEKEVNEQ